MSTEALPKKRVTANTKRDRGRNISFVADLFDKSVQWVRWCESEGKFRRPDNTYIIPRRTQPANAAAGFRKYTLHDIREMNDSLLREGLIDRDEHEVFMQKLSAWGYKVDEDAA